MLEDPATLAERMAHVAQLRRWRLIALVIACLCVPVGGMVMASWLNEGQWVGLLIGGGPIVFALGTLSRAHSNYTRTRAGVAEYEAKHGGAS